jgi:integrase
MGKYREAWLSEYTKKQKTFNRYSADFDNFCEWANTTDEKLIAEHENLGDKAFAKKWGSKIVEYYNYLISVKKEKVNSARSRATSVRSFFTNQCTSVKIKRGAISAARMATQEHEFQLFELKKMYAIGDIQDKARLATAISLGWGVSDFLGLTWNFIEPHLAEGLEPPISFWFERGKTGAPVRAHLTHEAIQALRAYRDVAKNDNPHVWAGAEWAGENQKHLSSDSMNDWLRGLALKAKVEPRGVIRFHLLRKFLFSALVNSGMSEIHAKIIIGKKVPIQDMTYLQSLAPALREGFMSAEQKFTLTGFTNTNHSKIDVISEEVRELKGIIAKQQVEMKERDIKIDALTEALAKESQDVKLLKSAIKKLPKLYRKTES